MWGALRRAYAEYRQIVRIIAGVAEEQAAPAARITILEGKRGRRNAA